MSRYTSILLPLAMAKKQRLEEAARSRGESLEKFILAAAEAEAERIGGWVVGQGHTVRHQVYTSLDGRDDSPAAIDEAEVGLALVASELGWEGTQQEWLSDIDQLIDAVDTLDQDDSAVPPGFSDGEGTRRGPRRPIDDLRLLNPVHGRVVDMSSLGFGIETYRPFSVPERSVFSIGEPASAAKIRAEVRWCLLVRTERIENGDVVPVYRSGLEFVGH